MSQRGGAVQSHLRISDGELFSDLIAAGHADLVIAVEPLESLRYVHMLGPDGALVASTNAFVNIGNYPPMEQILDRISEQPRHVLIDADRLARAAGSGRSANIVSLGAASVYLALDPAELEDAAAEMFAAKGEKVVEVNRRAFRFGRNAAMAYLDGLERGGTSRAVRHWIETLDADHLAAAERPDAPAFDVVDVEDRLSGAEAHAVERTMWNVYEEDRRQLYEHEVYQIVQLVGAISPPHHVFVKLDELITPEALAQFPGDRVVLKIVSPEVVHKSDAGGIVFCNKDADTVRREIDRLIDRHRGSAEGVLVVEYVPKAQHGFGDELFVGIRATREFGPVIAAGLGGIDTEYLASTMRPGLAVAKALATDTTAEDFFELFKQTAAYDIFSGQARGHRRIVSDGELLRCFRAFISIAQRFCVDRGEEGPDVAELEVNPFAFRQQRMVPLDGRGQLATATPQLKPRPIEKVQALLEPASIAILGVSAKSTKNFGRIILNNIIDCGFDRDHLYVVKPDEKDIDGVPCAVSIEDLPEPVDLLVIAASADQLPGIVDQSVESGKVKTAIMIPGGVGETEGSEDISSRVRQAIAAGRTRDDGGPIFLGPNCLGVQSRPGKYDTFFIPPEKVDQRRDAPARRVALVSQSGAFIVSRLSNIETLDPALTISIGNQIDLTISDVLLAVGERDDIDTIGLYVEGFSDLDGLAVLRAVDRITASGKTVVFYKAGRTAQGRDAAAGHTAAVAGDYDICEAGAENAGALVADTFKEFEQLIELSAALHEKRVRGVRLGAISNAGYETVGMADTVHGRRYAIRMADLSESSRTTLAEALDREKLTGIVNVRNPLDLTPMAGASAYESAVRVMLDADEVDAVLVSCVPLTPALATTGPEIASATDSLTDRLPKLLAESDKPLAVVIDSGARYEPLVGRLRAGGVPVFRSADQAVRSLGRYMCHRAEAGVGEERREGGGEGGGDDDTPEIRVRPRPIGVGAL